MDERERAALIARLIRDYGGLKVPGRSGLPYPGYEEYGIPGRAKIDAFNLAGGGNALNQSPALSGGLGRLYLEAVKKAYEAENEMQRLIGRAGSVPYPPEGNSGYLK